jgi:hypothetical protein
MSKIKIVLGYVLSFALVVLLTLIAGLLILKYTAFSKINVKKSLQKIGYYDLVSDEILDNMKSYMISSGLSDEVLVDLYTNDDVHQDIDKYIDYLYGSGKEVDYSHIENKLNTNIDAYLLKYNIKIVDQESLELFKVDIKDIYIKEVSLYGYLNNYTNLFKKASSLINLVIIINSVLLVFGFLFLQTHYKDKYNSSIFIGSGLILLFANLYINTQLDINNIIIISNHFSNFLHNYIGKMMSLIIIYAIILCVLGLILAIVTSKVKSKPNKRK